MKTIETYAKQLIEIGDGLQFRARVSDASLNTCEFMNNSGILVKEIGKDLQRAKWEAEFAILRAENERLRAGRETLERALTWYGENARLAKLAHIEGDSGRRNLASDGGALARDVLKGGE